MPAAEELTATETQTVADTQTATDTQTVADTQISVVIPALNEARNIGAVLRAMPPYVAEIVLVDGNSQDGTVETAYHIRPDIKVVHQSRQGKGNALAAGFTAATGRYVVMIDADGSMDPAEIGRFVNALEAGADYAKGSRFVAGGGTEDITPLRQLGNSMLNALTNLLFGTHYSDLCYGYNAFRRECLPVFGLAPPHASGASRWGDGFEIETVLNTRAARAKIKVAEVASFEHRRMFGDSHLRTFRDGARVLAAILRERLAWHPTGSGAISLHGRPHR